MRYVIVDWANNLVFNTIDFESFDDAESYLAEFLGDNYDTDRQEYVIGEVE